MINPSDPTLTIRYEQKFSSLHLAYRDQFALVTREDFQGICDSFEDFFPHACEFTVFFCDMYPAFSSESDRDSV